MKNIEQPTNDKQEQEPESLSKDVGLLPKDIETSKTEQIPKKKVSLGTERQKLELERNYIVKEPPKKRGPKTKPVNEAGQKLKKDGTVDKRAVTSKQNVMKSRVYQEILARKESRKLEENKKVIYTPIVESDSEDEIQFEIEKVKEPPVEVVEPPKLVRQNTIDYLKKQEDDREKMLQEALKKMEDENKKLKNEFSFNSHLNRISLSSRSMKLKF